MSKQYDHHDHGYPAKAHGKNTSKLSQPSWHLVLVVSLAFKSPVLSHHCTLDRQSVLVLYKLLD